MWINEVKQRVRFEPINPRKVLGHRKITERVCGDKGNEIYTVARQLHAWDIPDVPFVERSRMRGVKLLVLP